MCLRSRRDAVVEVEKRVDLRHQCRRATRANAGQLLAAGEQQLVAELELLGEVGFAAGGCLHVRGR
jgi:hypothetical protein